MGIHQIQYVLHRWQNDKTQGIFWEL